MPFPPERTEQILRAVAAACGLTATPNTFLSAREIYDILEPHQTIIYTLQVFPSQLSKLLLKLSNEPQPAYGYAIRHKQTEKGAHKWLVDTRVESSVIPPSEPEYSAIPTRFEREDVI